VTQEASNFIISVQFVLRYNPGEEGVLQFILRYNSGKERVL